MAGGDASGPVAYRLGTRLPLPSLIVHRSQTSDPSPDLAREIETLFDNLSAAFTTVMVCKECHSVMTQVDTIFFCENGLRSWNIPLPVCPQCCEQSLNISSVRAA